MQCPRCPNSELLEKERDGVTLDVCPACRGVWLDRGELERLQAFAMQEVEAELRDRPAAPLSSSQSQSQSLSRRRDDDDDDDDDDDRRRHHGRDERRDERHPDDRRDLRHRGAHGDHPPRKRRWFEVFDLFD